MIIFLVILSIIFIIFLLFFIFCLSTLQIEVENLEINSKKNKGNKIEDYLIYIRLKLLNKLTWIKLRIDKERVNKFKKTNIFKKEIIKIEKNMMSDKKQVLKKDNLQIIKQIKIEFEEFKMNLKIGLIDPILTSLSVAFISTVISIVLAKTLINKKEYKYLITPSYNIEPIINIKLNCIINIKLVHIINTIYMLIKKRSVKKDERTSNRRSYDCSNEEYSRYG